MRELRLSKGWSQQQLCDAAGGDPPLSPATISSIERGGHTTTDTLARVATAFEVPICLLFLEEEQGMLTPGQVEKLGEMLKEAAVRTVSAFLR